MSTRDADAKRNTPLGIWRAGRMLAHALAEQRACIRSVYEEADRILRPPAGSPPEYAVRLGKVPDTVFTLRRNLFSTLFYSTYFALEIPRPRRLLYGKINHLFRIWVTSADNLLDHEDKCVLPLDLPGNSRVMREVVCLMTADRVLHHLLDDAVSDGTITRQQASDLADATLQNLLPSAAQEAGEEGGVTRRPPPEYVLETVHLFKTGLLFHIPFTGVTLIERMVDPARFARIQAGLLQFGNACQILDDIRDIARDFVENRNNYVLSLLAHQRPEVLDAWSRRTLQAGDRLYFEVPGESFDSARLGYRRLASACEALQSENVLFTGLPGSRLAQSMFEVLDLEDLAHACAFA